MPHKGAHKTFAPLPSTLERSPKHAQDTYEKTLEQAEHEYTNDASAHQVAWGAVKHSFEKVGDHWEKKANPGSSDPRSESGGAHPKGESYGGVDVNGHSRDELMKRAHSLGLDIGRHATKADLAEAIDHENRRLTHKGHLDELQSTD